MTDITLELDLYFLISQGVGFLAMAAGMISYQRRTRIGIITFNAVSNVLWVIQYFMLGAYSAVVANAIAAVRNIVYCLRGRWKPADSRAMPLIFACIFAISGVFTYRTPFDILPVLAMCIASFAFFFKSERLIRWLSVGVAALWLSFSVYAGSISGMISDSMNLITIIIGIIRYRKLYSEPVANVEEELQKEQSNK